MARLSIKSNVLRQLFASSGNQCAFPGCTHILVDNEGDFLGQLCHIEAAEKGGERYNPAQTDEDRRSYNNLILFCYQHHIKTNNVIKYPASILAEMKCQHEQKFRQHLYKIPKTQELGIFDRINDKLDKLVSLAEQSISKMDELENSNSKNSITLNAIETQLSLLIKSNPISSADVNIYSEKLDFIFSLRKKGQIKTALESLYEFKKEKWAVIDEELKYKVIANIATIHFGLKNAEEAASVLLKLETVNFESENSLSYLALAYAILGDAEKFNRIHTKGLLKDSTNANLWIGYVYLYANDNEIDKIVQCIPSKALENSEVLMQIGNKYLEVNNTELGFKYLTQGIQAIGQDIKVRWHPLSFVAEKRLAYTLTKEKIAFHSINEQDKVTIGNCIKDLSEAWAFIENTELIKSYSHVLMNRGVALKFIGETVDSQRDLEQAWYLSDSFQCFKNLFVLYLETDQLDRAFGIISYPNPESLTDYNRMEFIGLRARYFHLKRDIESAIALLSTELATSFNEDKIHIFDLICLTYFEFGLFAEALPKAQQFVEEFHQEPVAFVSLAVCKRNLDDIEAAKMNLGTAKTLIKPGENNFLILYQIGIEFYLLELYEESIECFEKIFNPDIANDVARKLINLYFKVGDFEKAEKLCVAVLGVKRSDTLASEILFRIYEATSRLSEAEIVLENFLINGQTNALNHFRSLGIKFYKRTNKRDKLRGILLSIKNFSQYELREQFVFARLLVECDEKELAINVAYEARLNNFENFRAHEYFVYFMMNIENDSENDIFLNQVSLNNSITLVDKSGMQSIFLITDDPRQRGKEILRSSDELSKLLVGKAVGDEIIIENVIGTGNVLIVKKITVKEVFAFQESLNLLESKFAGATNIVFFKGDSQSNPGEIRDFLIENSENYNKKRAEVLRAYNAGVVTIGMLAKSLSKKHEEMWGEMLKESGVGIYSYRRDETPDLEEVLMDGKPIVLDLSALLTLGTLLHRLSLLEDQKCILAQSVYDQLLEFRDSQGNKPIFKDVHPDSRDSTKIILPNDDTRTQTNLVDSLLNWCLEHCFLYIPKTKASLDSKNSNLIEVIGQSDYDTLQIAIEQQGVLMSDDDKLKQFSNDEYGLKSFSSYQLITYLVRTKSLSEEEFTRATRILLQNNFLYIPVRGSDLWYLFSESGFSIKKPFETGAQGMLILRSHYAAKTFLIFSKNLYLNINLRKMRDRVLIYLLQVIRRRVDFPEIKSEILRRVDQVFKFLPTQRDELKSLVINF
ncbi:MAG: tetratricopeptide repeat protein [Agriterribacter sp.]